MVVVAVYGPAMEMNSRDVQSLQHPTNQAAIIALLAESKAGPT